MSTRRFIYTCKTCKTTWAIDFDVCSVPTVRYNHAAGYKFESTRTEYVLNGQVVKPEYQDCATCRATHQTARVSVERVNGRYNPEIKCSAKCVNAKRGDCECSCGGKNHGAGHVH